MLLFLAKSCWKVTAAASPIVSESFSRSRSLSLARAFSMFLLEENIPGPECRRRTGKMSKISFSTRFLDLDVARVDGLVVVLFVASAAFNKSCCVTA